MVAPFVLWTLTSVLQTTAPIANQLRSLDLPIGKAVCKFQQTAFMAITQWTGALKHVGYEDVQVLSSTHVVVVAAVVAALLMLCMCILCVEVS
jgi:hypothetical protein